jgi:hypothetical protein
MEKMMKFEMEVLNEYTYSELFLTNEYLKKALFYSKKLKEEYMYHGDILSSVEVEKTILRIHENFESVELAMTNKELSAFDDRFTLALISLN